MADSASTARTSSLRRLEVQEAATRALADADSLPEALEGILGSVCLALDWQRGEAWTVDPGAGALRLVARWHAADRTTDAFDLDTSSRTFSRGEGLPGTVWDTAAPVFIEDVTSRNGSFPRLRAAADAGLRSAVGFPIDVGGDVVGAMCFYTVIAVTPDDTMLRMLESIGQQIGNVIRRRRAEAAVRESEARKRAVLDAALDCVVSIDHQGIILELNRAAVRTFGYRATEAVGRPMADLIVPPHLRERHKEGFARHVETGETTILGRRIELEAMRKGGEVFPVELTIMRIEGEGAPSFTAYIRDISDRRHAEDRLREEIRVNETLQRLSLSFATERDEDTLLQLITDTATVLCDAEYGAFFFNAPGNGGDSYLLYTLSGAERRAFESFPMPRKTPLFEPTFQGKQIVRLDDVRDDPRYGAMGPQPEGHPLIVSYLAVPVKAPSGEVHGGLFFGHSEPGRFTMHHERIVAGIAAHAAVALDNLRLYDRIRKSEQTAHSAYRMAADAARRKDEFIAMLSHELRNPLAPIMTAIELMKMDPSDDTQASSRVVIERQAKHLLRLVDDLLDISRITRGKISLERRPVAVKEAVEAAIEMASPLFEKHSHRLHVEIEDGLWVRADRARLAQIVTNLLTNSARYTDPGGDVWLSAVRCDGRVEIRVRDSGIGMEADLLERVFDPFSQGKQEIDRAQGGLGLGLTLVKTLTELHDGEVEARSEGVGLGSELIVRLPAIDTGEQSRPSVTPTRGVVRPAGTRARVLVVDDNPDAAEIMARGLRRLGYEVRVAHDGPTAIALASELAPEIAVLDIGLPVMDGYELARRLRGLTGLARLRLIAVTGYGQISDRMRSRAAGFDAHLVKPVSLEDLAEALES